MKQNWFSGPMPDEVSYDAILERESEFRHWNYEPFANMETGYEAVEDELRSYTAEQYNALSDEEKEKLVDKIVSIFREVGVFPGQYFNDMGIWEEIEKCIAYTAKFDGDTVSCVNGGTKYFNGKKWKHISNYTPGDKVLQFNEDGTATLVDPIEYIAVENDKPFYRYRSGVLKSCQTGDHDVVYHIRGGEGFKKIKQEEIINNPGFDGAIPVNCKMEGKRVLPTEDISRYAFAIHQFVGLNPSGSRDDYNTITELFDVTIDSRIRVLRKAFNSVEDGVLLSFGSEKVGHLVYDLLALSGHCANFSKKGHLLSVSWLSKDKEPALYFSKYERLEGDERPLFEKVDCRYKYCFVVPSHMLVLRNEGCIYVTGNCGVGVGSGLCNFLFPNINDVPTLHDVNKKDASTVFERFNNDEYLRKAIKFCFSYRNGSPTPSSVLSGVKLVGSAPSNFRPMNAKAIYERFCPEGGVIYDPCCGFGGRLLGALSSKKNFRYVGTDPCTETMYNLHRLGEYIETTTGRDESYELHCCGSEVFKGPANSIDFVFTSPPYFNLELYSTEETQCFNKFPVLEDWLEGYVRGTIKNIIHMLKPGRYCAINIADFKCGGDTVAYVDEWVRISEEEGLPLFDTVYLGVNARAGSRQQQFGEKKKENILIFKKPM